ncbi:MAG TPA: hypothetical protein VMU77_03735 [Acidimicrobiales bacterium]|nr:hypothetical protein [Acidimicrobiales bacterium]
MKGKWAAGIPPRYFTWMIKDRLGISERPGGYARNHRPVRRQEEIIWLREQGFSRIVSLLSSPHNLHAYEEFGLTWAHFPMPSANEAGSSLVDLYKNLIIWLQRGEKLLVHEEEMGDKVMGIAAGFLLWEKMVPSGPVSIAAVEKMCQRQLGSAGRAYVAIVVNLPERNDDSAEPAPEQPAEPATELATEQVAEPATEHATEPATEADNGAVVVNDSPT